jgi:hypothetical protein
MPYSRSADARGTAETRAPPKLARHVQSKSAPHLCPNPGKTSWGGSRNRADRTSEGLSHKQASGIIAAAQSAAAMGLPLNAHVTIHWERQGVPDSAAAKATGSFLTCVRDWLRKQGLPFAYAYARENGDGKGSHVHILLHLPPGSRWHFQRSRRWLEAVSGGRYRKGVVVTARVRGTAAGAIAHRELYAANLQTVVGYLTKGALPCAAHALGLVNFEPGGRVAGKRAGWSQNVGGQRAIRRRVTTMDDIVVC